MEEEFKKLELEKEGWNKHFNMLIKKSQKYSSETGESAINKIFNRYVDVLPYDRSRIKLSRTTHGDYINANLVTVPKAARQYILTQGPLPETVGHFWLMVWEQKSSVIVMLNKCVEVDGFVRSVDVDGFVKCEKYWPTSPACKTVHPEVQLSVTLIKVDEEKHFTIRHILLEDLESKKTREISQFQYKAWPDHDQPDSPTSFLRLLTAIRKSGGLDKMDEPTIVHCSAGIGRSGTFCLIDSVLSMVENQGSTEGIDIANTLLEMREYRMGLIQSPVQLRFAYMSIIYGIKILGQANKLHPHMSSMTAIDKSSHQKTNGTTSQSNGKKQRRNKKRQSSSNNSSSLNVFNKHLLVEAMDDIESDAADALYEDSMKHLPSLKKARNSAPDNFHEYLLKQIEQFPKDSICQGNRDSSLDSQRASSMAKRELPANVESKIPQTTDCITGQSTESVLLRRRERELRNQRLAEKTNDIKNRMKIDELKKERRAARFALFKKSALFGGVAVLISSIAYMYARSIVYRQ